MRVSGSHYIFTRPAFPNESTSSATAQRRNAMKITYDPEVDAAYIYLTEKPGGKVTTAKVNEHIFLDYGAADELVGLEILDASEVLGFDRSRPEITIDKALGVLTV